jgi:hypothetical protein
VEEMDEEIINKLFSNVYLFLPGVNDPVECGSFTDAMDLVRLEKAWKTDVEKTEMN